MPALERLETLAPPLAIALAGEGLASGSETWTALPDLGETAVSLRNPHRGTDYLHRRFLSPVQGRFLSVDPIGGDRTRPQSWNRYTYVQGNPLKYVDPTGEFAFLAVAWAAVEAGLTLVDAVNTVKTLADPDASTATKTAAVALTLAGAVAPAGGLTALDDVVKGVAKGVDNVASMAARGTTVIGRFNKATGNIDGIRAGENSLLKHLPNQGSPKANWAQNAGVLRQEMNKGLPIRDAAVNPRTGELVDYPGSFLNAERNLLRDRGWTYDPATTLWSPP